MVTLFNGADIKVEFANLCAAMDTLIDQDVLHLPICTIIGYCLSFFLSVCSAMNGQIARPNGQKFGG